MKKINLLFVAVVMAVSSTTVAASERQSITIETGDLDLETKTGQQILDMRIQRAARKLCRSDALVNLPHNIRRERQCVRQARASTEAAMKALAKAGRPVFKKGASKQGASNGAHSERGG